MISEINRGHQLVKFYHIATSCMQCDIIITLSGAPLLRGNMLRILFPTFLPKREKTHIVFIRTTLLIGDKAYSIREIFLKDIVKIRA